MHSVSREEYKNLPSHLNSPPLHQSHPPTSTTLLRPRVISSPLQFRLDTMNPFKAALEKCFRAPFLSSPAKPNQLSQHFRHFLSISQAHNSPTQPSAPPPSHRHPHPPANKPPSTFPSSPPSQKTHSQLPTRHSTTNSSFCMTRDRALKRKLSSSSFAFPSLSSASLAQPQPLDSCRVHTFAPLKRPRKEKMVRLLDLADDLLVNIMTHVMMPAKEGSRRIITEESIRASLPLAQTCHALYHVWRNSMHDLELWVSDNLTDRGLTAICKGSGRAIHRLGLRRCTNISNTAFNVIPRTCTRLRSIDLSHADITDDFIIELTKSTGRTLQILALHGCTKLTARSFNSIADRCPHLRFLDIGSIPAVNDSMVAYLVQQLGASVRTMVLSHCKSLSDSAMAEIGNKCKSLMSLTIRGLPSITDSGLQKLCSGIGERVQILDVLDCTGLTMGGYFATMEAYCPHVFQYLEESNYVDHLGERCLQDNIIATMPGLIYRVSATDAIRRLPALYFLLLDESTLRPFRVSVQSKSLNLSDFGTVLISNFGKRPTQKTRNVLHNRFGYDSPFDPEADDESCD